MGQYTTEELAIAIKQYALTSGFDLDKTVIRISAGEEQERVIKYGSSRVGKSDKIWDKIEQIEKENLPRYPLRHDEIIIASTFEDFMNDSVLENGTFAHKLKIYKNPFISFYNKDYLIKLLNENEINKDSKNQGIHWLFKSDKKLALIGIADIVNEKEKNGLPLRIVPLSGHGIPRLENQPKRFYFALTNFCNRSCELCSCHSDPTKSTFIPFNKFKEILNCGQPYEAQLEGGEPLLHPEFWNMIDFLNEDEMCKRINLCTNAVLIDWNMDSEGNINKESVKEWLLKFNKKPFLLKPSVNSHLIKRDVNHLNKMVTLREVFENISWKEGSFLQYNIRRDPRRKYHEKWITEIMKNLRLDDISNDFLFQRIGRGEECEDLVRPYIIPDHVDFELISPDGKFFNFDLIERAKHMKNMN